MLSRRKKATLLNIVFMIVTVTLMTVSCFADEPPFGYLYTTASTPKGEWEYEQWNTVRTGKASGSYTALDLLNEFEHGFTDNFSGAFYLHSSYLHTRNVPDPDNPATNLDNQTAFDLNGVSVELKDRLLNPQQHPIGLTLYMEPELGVRDPLTGADTIERAVEFKLIVDKHFWGDRLILASNVVFEPEWERQNDVRSKELKNEYSFGAAYQWAAAWYGGLEFLNRRKFDDQDFAKQGASAFFLGPTLHYTEKEWWATLTVLPQIAGNPASDGSRTLGEYEKMEIRLRLGTDF
jgi:hypothetical protein